MPKKPNKYKKKPNGKNATGRPSKKDTIPYNQLKYLYRQGATDKQVAEFYGITEATLTNWKKQDSEFFASLNDWKKQADKDVERSLYERACGYTHPETKPQWVNDDNGGRWEYADMEKHYPPDATSMIFWLKNRQPDKWREKQEVEHMGNIVINAPDIKKGK
jgi:acyl-CoA synthetase (AMP-forming)/AMP-acid ligase II